MNMKLTITLTILTLFAFHFLMAQEEIKVNLQITNNSISTKNGFNAAFLGSVFDCDIDNNINNEGLRSIEQLAPQLLRYPGGTISQHVHLLNGTGYGLDSSELAERYANDPAERDRWLSRWEFEKDLECRNIDQFIDIYNEVKSEETEVIFVANMYSDAQEDIDAIAYLKNNGINIVGVEMGNETYNDSNTFTNFQTYIDRALPIAQSLRQSDPEIKLSWVAAPPITTNRSFYNASTKQKFEAWNNFLGQQVDNSLIDAVSIHLYCNYYYRTCTQQYADEYDQSDLNTLENTFKTGSRFFENYSTDSIFKTFDEYDGYFGSEIPYWITEWSMVQAKDLYGNSILDASFATSWIHAFNQINAENNHRIEYLCRQKLAGPGSELQNAITIRHQLDDKSAAHIRRTSWYAFYFLKDLFSDEQYLLNTQTDQPNLPLPFYTQGYLNKNDNIITISCVNENDFDIPLSIENLTIINENQDTVHNYISSPVIQRYISGEHLYSSAGYTKYLGDNVNFSSQNKPLFEIDSITGKNYSVSTTGFTFPKHSIGTLQFGYQADSVTSIIRDKVHEEFSLVPNPLNGSSLHLKNIQNNEDISVRIFDAEGRELGFYPLHNHRVIHLVQALTPGIYFVKLFSHNIVRTKMLKVN